MKPKSSAELFEESLKALAQHYPNSIVADLLTHFSSEVVMELIQIYSGHQIRIPRVETVWNSYRNKVIRDTLDVMDSKVAREQLAVFFGISSQYVAVIYSHEKRKHPTVSFRTTKSIAKRLYRDKIRNAFKEAEDVLFRKCRSSGKKD